MRLKLMRFLITAALLYSLPAAISAQSCIPTGINGTVINLSCNQVCSTLVFPIPHIKSTSDYTLTSIPYTPLAWTTPTGSQSLILYCDDEYGDKVIMPFPFCFYDSVFSKLTVGSNGLLTFDTSNVLCGNAYTVGPQTIPGTGGGGQCTAGGVYYPKASIMIVYTDLDPRPRDPSQTCSNANASLPDRKIEWRVEGTAPCRKFVLSYYNVGTFGRTNSSAMNTLQAVLYESTGIIEYFILNKSEVPTTSGGRAIMGIQNWNRDKATFHPQRNATVWPAPAVNEGWRFTPSGGASRYIICEMLDMSGNVIAVADTFTTTPGILNIRFTNFCTSAGTNQYQIRTKFSACEDPNVQLVSLDIITINRTNSLNATATKTDATCGPPDGTITVTVPPGVGTPPYTYVLDGGAPVVGPSPYTFTNVAPGAHTIVVTDASGGCTNTINITVNLNGTISAGTITNNTSCVGVNNGSITITSAGGTGPYTFSLDGAPPVAGTIPFTFNNVSAGIHIIFINDIGTGCNSGGIAVTILNGTGANGNATMTPTACVGSNTGTIIATATAGTAPFTWSFDGGPFVPGTSPVTYNNVSAGTHNITIRDANGCSVIVSITVMAGPGVSGNATATPTSCTTSNDGTMTVTALTGTAPFTWSLDGAPAVPGTSPFTFNNLAPGTHNVTITDVNNCSIIVSATVTAGSALTATTSNTSTSCPTASNGSITITSATGTGPYTFALDGGAPQAGTIPYTFNNIASGAHMIVVTDATGCSSAPIPVTVNAGPGITATTTSLATSCSGANNGSITVTSTSGTAPFTFSINGGAPQSGTPPFTFNNLAAGNHNIVVTDAVGCATATIIENVPAGPALTTTVNVTDVLCNGDGSGVINVTVPTIGTPPYQYSLDGITWQASNIFNGLAAGSYTVYYRESNGCQGSQPATVNEPTVLSATNTTIPVVCAGQSNGTITINSTGGVPPYQYSIDGGANWVSSNVFNVSVGSYIVIIRDFNNCTTVQVMSVTQPPLLTASSINTNASCNGGNDGTITVTANGGNGTYQYSIDGVNFQSNNFFNVAPGPYTVTVKDNLGCTTSFPAVVNLSNNLTFTAMADATICEGTSTQLDLVSNASVYTWTPALGLSSTSISNPVANPTVSTEYYVTATLDRCLLKDTVWVNVNAAPIPDAGSPGSICFGQTYQLQGSGGIQYSWTPGTYLNDTTIANPVSSPIKTILYTVTIVADANGCASLTTDNVLVDVTPPIKINTYPYDTIAYPGDLVPLLAVSKVPAANSFVWSPATNLSDPNIPNPMYLGGNVGDVNIYTVTATSPAGCSGVGYIRVRVYKGPALYTPSGFTPNGDGKNDKFYPFPVGIKAINYFKVFNRWGQLVFSSTTLYQGWDGKLSGVQQPTGVYVWMAEGIDKNGRKLTRQGTVTLIR